MRSTPLLWGLRLATVAALAVDAVVHLRQASNYQLASPGGIGAGNLFRIEAVVALLVAVWVLLRGSRPAFGAALVVTASAFAAVVLYRYVDVPAIGPIPSMYEPIWYAEKSLSAVAEGAGALLAAAGLLLPRPSPSNEGGPRTRSNPDRPPYRTHGEAREGREPPGTELGHDRDARRKD